MRKIDCITCLSTCLVLTLDILDIRAVFSLTEKKSQCFMWNFVSISVALGAVPSPFDCYLCNRGLKTLKVRMKQHFHNALAVARFLESDSRVEKVIFPGVSARLRRGWRLAAGLGLGAGVLRAACAPCPRGDSGFGVALAVGCSCVAGAELLYPSKRWQFMQILQISGLPSHPQHELVKRQCTGCPGMVTFYIKGNLAHAATFLKSLKVNDGEYAPPWMGPSLPFGGWRWKEVFSLGAGRVFLCTCKAPEVFWV